MGGGGGCGVARGEIGRVGRSRGLGREGRGGEGRLESVRYKVG